MTRAEGELSAVRAVLRTPDGPKPPRVVSYPFQAVREGPCQPNKKGPPVKGRPMDYEVTLRYERGTRRQLPQGS